MNHDDFIGIYDNVLSIDVCADTIHWYEQNVSNEGMREKRKVDQGYIDMLTITKPQRVPSFNNLHRSIVHNLNEAYIEYTNTFLHCNQRIRYNEPKKERGIIPGILNMDLMRVKVDI